MGQIWARHVPVSLDIWEDEKDEMCSGKIAQREGGERECMKKRGRERVKERGRVKQRERVKGRENEGERAHRREGE